LKEYKDTVHLFIVALEFGARRYPITASVDNLPYDSLSLLACAKSLGGVIVLTCNSIIHVSQNSKVTGVQMSGWATRVSDLPLDPPAPDRPLDIALEGSQITFVDEKTLFVILKDGTVYPVEIILDGRAVSKLVVGASLAETAMPSTVINVAEHLVFVGSTMGPSALLKASRVDEPVSAEQKSSSQLAAVVDMNLDAEFDVDDDGQFNMSMQTPC
jgi:cleavage and polyadenylation specificity factor subunit 1